MGAVSHAYAIDVPPKSLRESINVVSHLITHHLAEHPDVDPHFLQRALEHLTKLGAECDRKRPTGTGGNHGDRHTPECGCGNYPNGRVVCPWCRGKGFNPLSRSDPRGPVNCTACYGRGWVDNDE